VDVHHSAEGLTRTTRTHARVVLVGYEDQDNLGLRYLSSRLREAGHTTRLVAFGAGPESVLAAIQEVEPHVVGFSLIFQYLVPDFAAVIQGLRAAGVRAHVTMGGHYASFEHEALLGAIPELDSVVRFEGEDTLVELAEHIADGRDWRTLHGLAFRQGDRIVTTCVRPGRDDLDELPWPDRDDIRYDAQLIPTASMLGSRGCPWQCSFCSIITFYEGNGTKGRRRRDPQRIVDEMEYLHRERGVRVILWQDDDFMAGGRGAVRWAHAIAAEAVRRGLHESLRWKLSCRSDEVRHASLAPLREAGLTHVYLGVESGSEANLENLNKLLEPEAHLRAGRILRELGISFDFGFMLLEPWSTFATVLENVAFLREFVGDGAATVGFCRMLPYVGTAVEKRLKAEGRLVAAADNLYADYRFLDSRLDGLYEWLLETFQERNFSAAGTQNLLRLLLFEAHLELPDRPVDPHFVAAVRATTALSNRLALDTVELATRHLELREQCDPRDPYLRELRENHTDQDARLRRHLTSLITLKPEVAQHLHATR
jgi:anaerobic magnesium-protoporphyrin IX monomethyl ester cyclase